MAGPPRARYHLRLMSNEVTQLLSALDQGDPHAASRLLPLGYEELRKLAAQRMAQEKPREGRIIGNAPRTVPSHGHGRGSVHFPVRQEANRLGRRGSFGFLAKRPPSRHLTAASGRT